VVQRNERLAPIPLLAAHVKTDTFMGPCPLSD
jgi:hypothetical protein